MRNRVVVLGAGFGGLEFSAMLSESMGDALDLTLIDKSDSFMFGFSKLDLMFGEARLEDTLIPYRDIVKPGVRFVQDVITEIDPERRIVTTGKGRYEADLLAVALGADYDISHTPGLAEGGNEFYSVNGAERLRHVIPSFTKGHAVVGVTSTPFKCPPAPSEAALLLDDYLSKKGVRDKCKITLVMPFGVPIPPSPDTSREILAAFAKRDITFMGGRVVKALEPSRHAVILSDGKELPYDLFLGIPKHKVPDVVAASGMAEDGWIPVDPTNLRTRFEGVYAFGDAAEAGVPKAGMFAEGAARVAARSAISDLKGGNGPEPYDGKGTCYVEYGSGVVGRTDMDFLTGTSPFGTYLGASAALSTEKRQGASERRARWFGGQRDTN